MNDYDKNNLMFIMQMKKSQLEDWFIEASEDDRTYAEELLAMAHVEIEIRELELSDDIKDVSEAKSFLKNFTLKGKVK